jgi:hypothetical protein
MVTLGTGQVNVGSVQQSGAERAAPYWLGAAPELLQPKILHFGCGAPLLALLPTRMNCVPVHQTKTC